MKQILSLALALFLLPCLAWAQYPSNGNQKITLGEQTTADGLIYRGVAATDTVRKPSIDTMAYMVLDTTTNIMWHYKKATSNAWLRLNLLPSDTASMLTNYYRSGRTGIIQSSDVPTLNQNTTGSAATLTTSRTFQTNLASTSTASFNGSANVTPGVTGTLPVANGGTGATTFTAGNILFGNGTTNINSSNNLFWDNANGNIGINTNNPTSMITIKNTLNRSFDNYSPLSSNGNGANIIWSTNTTGSTKNDIGYLGAVQEGDNQRSGRFYFHVSNNSAPEIVMTINKSGNLALGAGAIDAAQKLEVFGNAKFTAVGTASSNNSALYVTDGGVLSTNSSDVNKKHNIRVLPYGLNTINQLNPVAFDWNENDITDIGFIAQDIESIIPESVITNWDSQLIFRQEKIVPILVKAIQEQQALIKALEQRIINLENK